MNIRPVEKEWFFDFKGERAPRKLLGMLLIHETAEGVAGGMISEVELYTESDPASHTFRGETDRNRAMFGEAGHVYVYKSYGIHHCMNVAANEKGTGEGVLVRSIEPIYGIEIMQERRGDVPDARLSAGPGNVTEALRVTLKDNHRPLFEKPLFLTHPTEDARKKLGFSYAERRIIQTPRIGISKAASTPWRFVLENVRPRKRRA